MKITELIKEGWTLETLITLLGTTEEEIKMEIEKETADALN